MTLLENPLSVSWFKNKGNAAKIDALRRAAETFFRHHAQTEGKLNLWSSYKDVRKQLSGDRYARGFESCNARATNKHQHKTSVAYLVNIYHHPYIRGYFEDAGVTVDAGLYALLTMVQFVWRSAIRVPDGPPITVYIPSGRMRTLFQTWLAGNLRPSIEGEPETDDGLIPSRKEGRRRTLPAVAITEGERFA